VCLIKNIDKEFEEFVSKHFKRLTDNQKKICSKLGISIPN